MLPISAPPSERTAEAIAEVRAIYAAYEDAVKQAEADSRVIQRLQDRIQMIEEDLRETRERAKVCERKLIRLAANQRNISRIAQDGDEIMRSVQDWQETEAETNQPTAREMAERFAPELGDVLNKVATLPINNL